MSYSPQTLKIFEILGWYGASAILGAYALISFNIVGSDSYIYQLLNLTGATGVMVISFLKHARQPAFLNLVWAIVAVVALAGLIIK